MIELDPLTIAQFTADAASVLAQGPPGELPAPVPDFVGDVLGAISSFIDNGANQLGETVRGLTPGSAGDAPGR